MDFINIAKQRFSVRSYTDQAVEKEKLDKILEPVNILAIGYSDEETADPERHSQMRIPISQLVSYENL